MAKKTSIKVRLVPENKPDLKTTKLIEDKVKNIAKIINELKKLKNG